MKKIKDYNNKMNKLLNKIIFNDKKFILNIIKLILLCNEI